MVLEAQLDFLTYETLVKRGVYMKKDLDVYEKKPVEEI